MTAVIYVMVSHGTSPVKSLTKSCVEKNRGLELAYGSAVGTLAFSPHTMCQYLLERVSSKRLIIGVITGMDLPERTRDNKITCKYLMALPQKYNQDATEAIS